jgi:hypothetical protein
MTLTVEDFQVGDFEYLHCALSATTGTATGATAANPVVITDATHGLTTGDRIRFTGFSGGMTQLNNRDFLVEVVDANSFKLKGEDGTGHDAYSTGGTWTKYTVTGLGYTTPGSTLTISREWRDRTADQEGTTPLDKIMIGEKCAAALSLLQTTPENLKKSFPTATLTGTAAGAKRTEGGGTLAGTHLAYENAHLGVLHPNENAIDDPTGEWRIYKAYVTDIGAVPKDHTNDQAFPLTVEGLPDRDRARGARTWGYFK